METKVSPGVIRGTRVQVYTAKATLLSTGGQQTWTYTGNVVGVHESSGIIKMPLDDRKPTTWRVFAAKVEPAGYSFTRGNPKWLHQADRTDTRGGHGPFSGYEFYGTRLSGGLRIPDVSDNLVNQVLMEASAKLRDQKLELLVSFAEARKTVNFLADLVSLIAKVLFAIRNGDPGAAIRAFTSRERVRKTRYTDWYIHHSGQGRYDPPGKKRYNDIGEGFSLSKHRRVEYQNVTDRLLPHNLWLEFRYAVLPLVYEVRGALSILKSLDANPVIIKGFRRQERNYGLPPNPSTNVYKHWETRGRVRVGAECKLRATVEDPYQRFLSRLGLTDADVLITAWELVPYSFVIDWLIPIGTMLSSFLSPVGLRFLDGYVNTKTVADYKISCSIYSGSEGTLPSVLYRSVCQYRQPRLNFPIPRLYMKSPFSTTNVTTAIALVTNLSIRR